MADVDAPYVVVNSSLSVRSSDFRGRLMGRGAANRIGSSLDPFVGGGDIEKTLSGVERWTTTRRMISVG